MPELVLPELLDFYDRKVPGSEGHASAINAVMGEDLAIALIKDYFQRKRASVRVVSRKCTQKTKKGKRLDAWIEITDTDGIFHYQTEIKNWSAHAIGGKAAPTDESDEAMRAYRINRWHNQFSSEKKTLKEDAARKVLVRMAPESTMHVVRPLIIFWDTMHPTGEEDAFFKVEVASDAFGELWVFSMSTHVRGLIKLGITQLSVEMEETEQRRTLLRNFLR
jgi:hypothetical protein